MTEFQNEEKYIKEEDLYHKESRGWKDKFLDFIGGKYFVPIAIILVAIIAFSLGRISGLQDKREPVRILNNSTPNSLLLQSNSAKATPDKQEGGIETNTQSLQNTAAAASASQGGQVVASKNGTKYHYPWCAGAKQISPQNIITFNSIEDARAKGYTPASNCKGLK